MGFLTLTGTCLTHYNHLVLGSGMSTNCFTLLVRAEVKESAAFPTDFIYQMLAKYEGSSKNSQKTCIVQKTGFKNFCTTRNVSSNPSFRELPDLSSYTGI